MTIVAKLNLGFNHLDIQTMFLDRELELEVYIMQQPLNFENHRNCITCIWMLTFLDIVLWSTLAPICCLLKMLKYCRVSIVKSRHATI